MSLSTVQFWIERVGGQHLDRVDFSDRRPGPRLPANKISSKVEDTVISLRRELKQESVLGEFGAVAIHREMKALGVTPLPSLRTVGRILERRGALDGRLRLRRPSPPKGWYLPEVAAGLVELELFDFVEGLKIQNGPEVQVLNSISLHGNLVASWPLGERWRSKTVVTTLEKHWRVWGVPKYAQFDNDAVFHGPLHLPDIIGRVVRLCLSLGVTPVFVPPREPGFQASIESYNGRWQAKVWSRFHHETLRDLQTRSQRYLEAHRKRSAQAIAEAPPRQPFPDRWNLDLQKPPQGCLIFLRRCSEKGMVHVLGHRHIVDENWPHRLVRAEVDLDEERIQFFALRRSRHEDQPLLKEVSYSFSRDRFRE